MSHSKLRWIPKAWIHHILILVPDVMTWNCFLHCWRFVRAIHLLLKNSPHKEPLMGSCHILFFVSVSKQLCKQSYCGNLRPLTLWWRHQMETFSALLAICAGNSPITDDYPTQRPVTRSFVVFFHLCLNKQFSKQSWGWWFETLSRPSWRHCNVTPILFTYTAPCSLLGDG